MNRKAPRITLYTTGGCSHCRQMKQWLNARGIAFREMDIQRNARALRDFQRLGGRGVPLLAVGGQIIRGFDARRLAGQLRRAGLECRE